MGLILIIIVKQADSFYVILKDFSMFIMNKLEIIFWSSTLSLLRSYCGDFSELPKGATFLEAEAIAVF